MARQSAAVYRRRRLVVFTGLLVVIALLAVGVWALVAKPWSAQAAPEPSPTPTPAVSTPSDVENPELGSTEAPTDEATAPPTDGVAPCVAANITVQAATDKDSYGAGELPQLSISLTNSGSADCTMDVGSATQVFTVTSGTDVWWRSTDCQTEATNMVVTLSAGQTVTSSAPVQWDRTRSAADTCDAGSRPVAGAGGASYHVAVSIGGFTSADSRQIILN